MVREEGSVPPPWSRLIREKGFVGPPWSHSIRSALVLSLLALLLAPVPCSSQSPSEQVHDFLDSARGFQLLGPVRRGVLEAGNSLTTFVQLLEGSEYMIVGFCGGDCSNMDLTLLDASGDEVQSDRLPDPQPILALTAESSGQYQVMMEMVECSSDRCDFAVGVLGSSGLPGVPPGEGMKSKLDLFAAELRALGFTELGEPRLGSLHAGQVANLPFAAEEDLEYRIAGVCDTDCFDLNLILWDDAGNEIASDLLEDPFPILAFRTDTLMNLTVEVGMAGCEVEPCRFRLAAFGREQAVGPGGAALSGQILFFETYRGELDATDQEMSEAFVDVYEIEARSGQRIIVDLRSDEFDTLLRLAGPAGYEEENDDYGTEAGHSRMEHLAVDDGVYTIRVTSFSPGEMGSYVLQIAVVE